MSSNPENEKLGWGFLNNKSDHHYRIDAATLLCGLKPDFCSWRPFPLKVSLRHLLCTTCFYAAKEKGL